MLINFYELLDESKECISVECLPTNWSAETKVGFEDIGYRESKPRGTGIHTFHVHVRSKERYFTVLILIRLHTLEKRLSILENNRRGFDSEWTVCEGLIRLFIVRKSGCAYMEQFWGFPSRRRRSMEWSTYGRSENRLSR